MNSSNPSGKWSQVIKMTSRPYRTPRIILASAATSPEPSRLLRIKVKMVPRLWLQWFKPNLLHPRRSLKKITRRRQSNKYRSRCPWWSGSSRGMRRRTGSGSRLERRWSSELQGQVITEGLNVTCWIRAFIRWIKGRKNRYRAKFVIGNLMASQLVVLLVTDYILEVLIAKVIQMLQIDSCRVFQVAITRWTTFWSKKSST